MIMARKISLRFRELAESRNLQTIFATVPVAGLAFVRLVLVLRDPAVRGLDQVGPGRRLGVAAVLAVALNTCRR